MGTAAVKLSLKKEEEQTGNINGHYITFQIRNEVLQSVRTAAVKQPLKKKATRQRQLNYSTVQYKMAKLRSNQKRRTALRRKTHTHTHTHKKLSPLLHRSHRLARTKPICYLY